MQIDGLFNENFASKIIFSTDATLQHVKIL